MEKHKERFLRWWTEANQDVRAGKWWLIGVPIVLWFVERATEHWFFGWFNEYIKTHLPEFIARVFAPKGYLIFPLIGLGITLGGIFIRAYFRSKPGIVGTADSMIQALEIPDLELLDGTPVIDLSAFVRMEIASLDRPRTVIAFEIEMTAPDGTSYKAKSEHDLGNYFHKYDVKSPNEWGAVTIKTVREPMEDLAAKLRIPIQPYTHVARAWVRFELPKVKHEPKYCRIAIFAIDPSGKRHEINTDTMKVAAIDDHEYASKQH